MNEPNPTERSRTPLAKCERHGLHYDPAKMTGCVICRREAQAEAGGTSAPSSSAATSATQRPVAGPLLIAAALCFGAGFALYLLHDATAKLVGDTPEMPAFNRRQQQQQIEEALREMNRGDPTMPNESEDDRLPPGGGIP